MDVFLFFLGQGVTWASVVAPTQSLWRSVCWSPSLKIFCAVASDGTSTRVMTSPDGKVWTTRVNSVNNDWKEVAWSIQLGQFCAVANTGSTDRVMTSTDGITWTTRTSATVTSNAWESVVYAPSMSLWAAIATPCGTDGIMTSTDGSTWTSRVPSSAINPSSIAYSASLIRLCTVSRTGGTSCVMTSDDGTTWTTRTGISGAWNSVCWSDTLSLFIAVGDDNYKMSSPDGITWTDRTVVSPGRTLSAVCWADKVNLFVALASASSGNDRIFTSPDGITWTTVYENESNTWESIVWSSDTYSFVAVASTGTSRIMVSGREEVGVKLNPLWEYVEKDKKIENEHRSRSGARYAYKWGSYRAWNIPIDYVSSRDYARINSYWLSNTKLLFQSGSDSTVSSVQITNDDKPISKYVKPYENLFEGIVKLETY